MDQYERFVSFSKEAKEQFKNADPQVKEAVMHIIEQNVQETQAKIEREIAKNLGVK